VEDIDSDGMADDWETEQFGSIFVSSGREDEDQDGDGFPDLSSMSPERIPTNRVRTWTWGR
jgi:hypothetical protein